MRRYMKCGSIKRKRVKQQKGKKGDDYMIKQFVKGASAGMLLQNGILLRQKKEHMKCVFIIRCIRRM